MEKWSVGGRSYESKVRVFAGCEKLKLKIYVLPRFDFVAGSKSLKKKKRRVDEFFLLTRPFFFIIIEKIFAFAK